MVGTMGLLTWLGFGPSIAPGSTTSTHQGIVSPWAQSQLQTLVWSDVFGTDAQVVTRAEAMSIPAVSKARSVLLALLADKPLVALDNGTALTDQPTWLFRTDGTISPWHRTALTLDDLMFYGWSLWATERVEGRIEKAERIPFERWEFDADGRILVDGKPVQEEDVLLIPGPSEGLLTYATRTLKGAAALETAWIGRAQNPIPALELHQTTDSGITEEEAKQVVKAWSDARHDPAGAVAFTPHDIEARALGTSSADLFIEGRNFTKLDVANFFALPASLLDGTVSQSTLTYSTQEGKRNEVVDYSLPYWTGPLVGRLSQDDVVPAGVSVRFDLSTLTTPDQSPTGAPVED